MQQIRTKNIQLASFLLTKISSSEFCIERGLGDSRHTIVVSIPLSANQLSLELVDQFHRCEANVSLFTFNAKLNQVRDSLKKG